MGGKETSTTFLVRNVPPALKKVLSEAAEAHGRSMNSEVLVALRRGLGVDDADQRDLFREIRDHAPALKTGADTAALIRRDRDAR